MAKKVIIAVLVLIGLALIIAAIFKRKATDTSTTNGGIPLPPSNGGGTTSGSGSTTTGGGTAPPVQIVTGATVDLSPSPFQGCVTPPADRQRYGDVTWDFRNVIDKYVPADIRAQFENKKVLEDYVHGALKAFDVRVNQKGVMKMQTEILRYLNSSDKKPYILETTGRLRCK